MFLRNVLIKSSLVPDGTNELSLPHKETGDIVEYTDT